MTSFLPSANGGVLSSMHTIHTVCRSAGCEDLRRTPRRRPIDEAHGGGPALALAVATNWRNGAETVTVTVRSATSQAVTTAPAVTATSAARSHGSPGTAPAAVSA